MEASNTTPGGGDTSERRLPEGRDETAYVILQQGTDNGYWPVETPGVETAGYADGYVRAGSAKQAIEKHLAAVDFGDDEDPTGRIYVAVPARSWKPIPVGGIEEVPAKRKFRLG